MTGGTAQRLGASTLPTAHLPEGDSRRQGPRSSAAGRGTAHSARRTLMAMTWEALASLLHGVVQRAVDSRGLGSEEEDSRSQDQEAKKEEEATVLVGMVRGAEAAMARARRVGMAPVAVAAIPEVRGRSAAVDD